ncbi:unnamed protein product [Larinioides sclopetarius]|uniref:Uncharacterized protein n=1 Tax=Larinioides sclopetarius TaxID=280406 RepID=A0AAV2A6F6_9ARAC
MFFCSTVRKTDVSGRWRHNIRDPHLHGQLKDRKRHNC